MAATPSKADATDSRYLDKSNVQKALDSALEMGATYAEIRLVSLSTGTASLRDGSLHRAVPGQEIAATLRG